MDMGERFGCQGPYGRLLPRARVLEMVGLGKTRIWELEKEDAFPRGRKIGKAVLYVEAEVLEFIASVAEGREYRSCTQFQPS